MKILFLSRNLPPLVGGMERLNSHILKSLVNIATVSVSGPNGCQNFVGGVNKIILSPALPVWKYLVTCFIKTLCFAMGKKFDFVFCGSGAAVLTGYFAAKFTSAKLICYLHGLDIIVENKIYQCIFLPLIRRCDILIVNSNYTKSLAIHAGIDEKKITILNPGVEIPDFSEVVVKANEFKKKYDVERKKIILIAGRITPRKGIVEFVESLMSDFVSEFENVHLIIVGGEAVDAIQQTRGVSEKIHSAIHELNLHKYVSVLGKLTDDELDSAFFAASVMAFPVLSLPGDVEGFGMVALEAAAHGVPTVAFDVGGVSDAVSEGISGSLVSGGDYKKMYVEIKNYLELEHLGNNKSVKFAQLFEWTCFQDKLFMILRGGDESGK